MAITLAQIPGFADVADSNFAAEQFAVGLNFQRTVDNAKFGVVRPEVFVGKYINGDTVTLPTSVVDGYTYTREELTYIYHYALTGGTSTSNNGAASAAGAIRYFNAYVDQLTGSVTTSVEYLVANGSGPTVTNDGTLEVFTIATRRQTSLVVAAPPAMLPIDDAEMATDNPVGQSLMQRVNGNAKFAALRAEVIYMGEFTDGETVPQPVSAADGYVYSYAETTFQYSWRWSTQGDQFVDPTNGNYKQIQDVAADIDVGTGLCHVLVTYYNSGYYPTNNGRIAVFAFCQRAIVLPAPGLVGVGIGVGAVNFVDLSPDFLASGRPVREDVLLRQVQNIRYSMLRREFFRADYFNGQTVALPVSPIDGYQYSRDELSYVYDFNNTGPGGTQGAASDIRINNWHCAIDQTTGVVSLVIVRVHDGGGLVTTNNGQVRVLTFARRDHAGNSPLDYPYEPGSGSGGQDIYALQNGGFDTWNKPTDQAAAEWFINQQSGAGYGAQSPGLVSGFSQRLGIGDSSTPQPPVTSSSNQSNTPHYVSALSSSVDAVPGALMYISFAVQPSVADLLGLTLTIYLYDAIGDVKFFVLEYDVTPLPGGLSQVSGWFQVPSQGDTLVRTNMSNATNSTVGINNNGTMLDFTPSTMRVELYFAGALNTYVDLDEVTLINQVDPSVGQVAQRGSDSIAIFPAIDFVVDDTSFIPDLDFYINRADGSITTSSTALSESKEPSGVVGCTGLTASTTYYWYPYYDELRGFVTQIEGGAGGVGTPPYLQSTATRALYAQWFAIRNVPLALEAIQITTTAPAAPPTGGSGGGNGRCLRDNQWVRTKRGMLQVCDLLVGDELDAGDGWVKVLHIDVSAHTKWCVLKFNHGGGMEVTTNHHFSTVTDRDDANDDAYKLVRAWDLTISSILPWQYGVCHPVSIGYKEELGRQVNLVTSHPHRFLAGSSKDFLTLTTARATERNCGCKERT